MKKIIATGLIVGLSGCSSLGGQKEESTDTTGGTSTEDTTDNSEANSGGSLEQDPGFQKLTDLEKETQDANSSVQESQEVEKDVSDSTSGL